MQWNHSCIGVIFRNREWYLVPDLPCCWPSPYFRSSVSSLMHRWSYYWAQFHSECTRSFCKPFKRHPMVIRSSEYKQISAITLLFEDLKRTRIHFTGTIWKPNWFYQRKRLRKQPPLAWHMWMHFWQNWDDYFWLKTLSTPRNLPFYCGYWPIWDHGSMALLSPSSVNSFYFQISKKKKL